MQKLLQYLLLILGSLIVSSCWDSGVSVYDLMESVSADMSYEEVFDTLSEQSWYHQPCPRPSFDVDLFFFGSREYERAKIIIVTSEKRGSDRHIRNIGTYDEPNAWQTSYRNCIQKDRFLNSE